MTIKLPSGFEVLCVSDLAYEYMLAEIQFDDEQIALVSIEHGIDKAEIEMFTTFLNKGFTPKFRLNDFNEAIHQAVKLLRQYQT